MLDSLVNSRICEQTTHLPPLPTPKRKTPQAPLHMQLEKLCGIITSQNSGTKNQRKAISPITLIMVKLRGIPFIS